MNGSVRVPIRIKPSVVPKQSSSTDAPAVAEAVPPVTERKVVTQVEPAEASAPSRPTVDTAKPEYDVPRPKLEVQDARDRRQEAGGKEQEGVEEESLEVWRDRALRLQAEIENFRKRQQRLSEERIAADRERLLRAFLGVADDLERALNADGVDADSLRQGVDLTYQAMMRLLDQEGAEPIQAEGQPFDPSWHEAVGTLPHQDAGVEPDTVVKVMQEGYRLGDRLLRPARVIVAA
jgi:molecular chaperone GrpE